MHTRGNDSESGAMRAEDRFRDWFDALEDLVYVVDRDLRLVFINAALRKAADMRGMPSLRVGDPLFGAIPCEELREGYTRVFQTGDPFRTEYEERLPGGERLFSTVRLTPVFGPDGAAEQVVTVITNITARKEMEETLRLSEARYRAVVEDSPMFICRFLPDGTITFVNETYTRHYNRGRDELLGVNIFSLMPEGQREFERREHASRTTNDAVRVDTHQTVVPGMGIRWHRWTDRAIFENGQLVEFQSIGEDITEQHRISEALRESEERLRLVVENSPDTIFIQDRDLRYTWVAHPTSPITVERAIGKSDDDLHPVVNHEERKAAKLSVIETGQPRCLEVLINNSGELRWQDATYVPYRGRDGSIMGIFGYSRDITGYKMAEEALRRSEERYRIVSELVSDYAYCFRVGPGGKLVREWVTEAFRRITGFTPEESDQKGGWLGLVHPEDLPIARRKTEEQLAGKTDVSELRILHKNGSVRWLRHYVFPVIGEDGKVERVYGAVQDITARKLLERNIEELRREYEIYMRHELKNLFIPLRLHAELLLRDSGDRLTLTQRKYLENILESTIQGAECVDSLRRIQELEAGTCGLNLIFTPLEPVISKAVSDLTLRGKERGVEIHFDCHAGNTELQIDPQLLPGVFFNLILNAIEHVEGQNDPGQKRVSVELGEKDHTLVTRISNRGEPVSPARLATFFEKFNGSGKGQGRLGLGTAYARLVTLAHGGDIRVESSEKEGTTVTVALPREASQSKI